MTGTTREAFWDPPSGSKMPLSVADCVCISGSVGASHPDPTKAVQLDPAGGPDFCSQTQTHLFHGRCVV